jgi:hypothetical protein
MDHLFLLTIFVFFLFSVFCTNQWKPRSTPSARPQPDCGQQHDDVRRSFVGGNFANDPPAISKHPVRTAPGRAHSAVIPHRGYGFRKRVSHPDPIFSRALSDSLKRERMRQRRSLDFVAELSSSGLPHGWPSTPWPDPRSAHQEDSGATAATSGSHAARVSG